MGSLTVTIRTYACNGKLETTDYDIEAAYAPLWWHYLELRQTASGYGKKLTTPYKVNFLGRWRRVYATRYSNAASYWVMIAGQKHYVTI